jgi:hypothetical protein
MTKLAAAAAVVGILTVACRSADGPSPATRAGPAWTAEPGGLTLMTDRVWTSLTGDGWQRRDSDHDRIVDDVTAPEPAGKALEYAYPAGFAGGAAPATHFYSLGGRTEVFVGLELEASRPWQGHDSRVNKIQFLLTSHADVMMAMYGPPSGPYELRVIPQWQENGDAWLVPNAANPAVTLGRWHRIEWYVKYASAPGARDGIVRWWMDGVLVGDHANVAFPDDGGFVEYQISPTWGGVGDRKQENDFMRFARCSISAR